MTETKDKGRDLPKDMSLAELAEDMEKMEATNPWKPFHCGTPRLTRLLERSK